MSDAELAAIRQKRLAELSGGQAGQDVPSEEDQAKQAQDAEDTRRTVMSQILDPQARERLARIALVRPERGRSVEELLVRMARSGQLRGRVSDDQLLNLLEQVAQAEGQNSGAANKSKITINRRQDKSLSDDEDDDFDYEESTAQTKRTQGCSQSSRQAATGNHEEDDDDIFDL